MPSDKINKNTDKNKKSESDSSLPEGKSKYPKTNKKEIKPKKLSQEKQELLEELNTLTNEELEEKKNIYIKNGFKTQWSEAYKAINKKIEEEALEEKNKISQIQRDKYIADGIATLEPTSLDEKPKEENEQQIKETEKQEVLAELYKRKEEIEKSNAEIRAALEIIMKQIDALSDEEEELTDSELKDIENKKAEIEKRRKKEFESGTKQDNGAYFKKDREEKERLKELVEIFKKTKEQNPKDDDFVESLTKQGVISEMNEFLNKSMGFSKRTYGNALYEGEYQEVLNKLISLEDGLNAKYDAELDELEKPNLEDERKSIAHKKETDSFMKMVTEELPNASPEVFISRVKEISRWLDRGGEREEKKKFLPNSLLNYIGIFEKIDENLNQMFGGRISKEEAVNLLKTYKNNYQSLDSITYKHGLEAVSLELKELETFVEKIISNNTKETVTEVLPSSIDFYLSTPNKDGSFNESSARKEYKDGASQYAFKNIGGNKFEVYVNPNEHSYKLMMTFPDKNINPVFDAISAFNPKAKSIQTITPAIAELEDGKFKLISKGELDFDKVGIERENKKG